MYAIQPGVSLKLMSTLFKNILLLSAAALISAAVAFGVSSLTMGKSSAPSAPAIPPAPVTAFRAEELQRSFAAVARKAMPSVVLITARKRVGVLSGSPWNYSRRIDYYDLPAGQGSGFFISPEGLILTNYHVVEDATMLEVTSGDKVYPAELKGTDEAKDIAVLYVEDLDIEPVVLGDSDQLSVGDWAICIGNPLSFTGTTTVGVISALNREVTSSATDAYGKRAVNTMIQTDAAINAGNSGGGMFNVAGELIGIPSMKYTGSMFTGSTVEGIGMAIPINEAKDLINDVLSGNGNVEGSTSNSTQGSASISTGDKPRIGVTVSNLNPNSYAVAYNLIPTGAYVQDVESGSPAEKAGVQVADMSFVENLNHTFRVAYWGGTNSPSMVKYMESATAFDLDGDGTSTEGPYLTTNDGLLEFNLTNVWQVYENLTDSLELGYIVNMIDKNTWDRSFFDSSFSKQDAWKASLVLAYTF